MNKTPSSSRVHIGFFGRRNAGKSSLVNAVTGQELAIVSEMKGTTTDPVYKAMELLPLGPVVIIDTPGIDDEGALGELRVLKAKQALNKTDVAVLVADASAVDARAGTEEKAERELIKLFQEKQTPFIIAYNKSDIADRSVLDVLEKVKAESHSICVSAKNKTNIDALKEKIATLAKMEEPKTRLVGDLISPSDFVALVVPIDKAAPKGRLILPQQQTIRDILEADGTAIVVREYELRETLTHLGKKPRLVITDSQVFDKVSADTPPDIPLTSFSILFARYNGLLAVAVDGVQTLGALKDNDVVLICEGCTHHRQCDDIGTVKLPRWIRNHTGKRLEFTFTSGGDFPLDLSPYKLIVHCGGCMLNNREMRYRQKCAVDQKKPITNYGVLIAYIQGILKRCVAVFPAFRDIAC
ncbi:MAG: [FeFe] hydrogenase H-cluster maturation GTPase HydF [Treponema sp.]|jgi:[FeFe] hydrogenase H-cluster maturation GTPase HydF|nr:[FeFe] hydrogenase H-cluster maturation GTPase HydF [Treponema sp.]